MLPAVLVVSEHSCIFIFLLHFVFATRSISAVIQMSSAYLQSLDVNERDALLASIVYVDRPKNFLGVGYDVIGMSDHQNILNYSQLYSHLGNRTKLPSSNRCLPSVNDLRTGDSICFGDNRGLGTFYVVWLKKGIYSLTETFMEAFKAIYKELDENTTEPLMLVPDEHVSKKAKLEKSFLFFASREADGPHNDGLHDCYLLTHYDEYGSSPSAAFASLPADYFSNLEVESMLFDPLLTHSQSHYGGLVTEARESEEWAEDSTFPQDYFGYFDENSDNELIWVPCRNEEGQVDIPINYVPELRTLFNDHFKPDDWVADAEV